MAIQQSAPASAPAQHASSGEVGSYNFRAPRPWPLLGMLAIGLVAGVAIGGYTVSQWSHMRRLAGYAHRMGDELGDMATDEAERPPTATRSNHRRKAAAEV